MTASVISAGSVSKTRLTIARLRMWIWGRACSRARSKGRERVSRVRVAVSATAEKEEWGSVTIARSVETEWRTGTMGLTSMPSGAPAKAPAMGSGRSGSIAFLPLLSWSGFPLIGQ